MSERRRNVFVLVIVLALVGLSVAVLTTRDTKLGLDLQGGVSLVYEAEAAREGQTLTVDAVDQSINIIRDRVDSLGVAEPSIRRAGNDPPQIQIDLPAVQNAERAADRVGSTAQMYFYDWELNVLDEECQTNPDTPISSSSGTNNIIGLRNAVNQASECEPYISETTTRSSAERYYGFYKTGQPANDGIPEETESDLWVEEPGGEKPEGAESIRVNEGILIVRAEPPPATGDEEPIEPDAWWVMQDEPALNGDDIENPEQNFDQQTNEPIVTMDFSDEGQRDFQRVTEQLAVRGANNGIGPDSVSQSMHFAIVLDNELVSVPYIDYRENPEGIDGRTGAQISGSFTVETAQELANFLKIGALPVRLELISRSQVSASLGAQALDQGLKAGIAGFAIVALFLIAFYRVLGLIAVTALAVYALYFYAIVKLVPIVLTLPGIAGLILTLGVAADANIVIFERVKEEVRRGRSTGAAISEGYKKGIATILDANVVTLLVAFILFILATAGVAGFAFTLGVGTIVSLFTAVLATQAILLSLRGTNLLKTKGSLGASGEGGNIRFDFMGKAKIFFAASGVILLIGALGIAGKGLELGIDFEAGTRIQAALAEPATVDEVRDVVQEAGFGEPEVQTLTADEIGDNVVQISTASLTPPQVDRVETALDEAIGLEANGLSSNSIGPSFGASIANAAIVAIIASLAVIAVYIALRFQWKFAVPVLIALMHDILITGGVYAFTDREVTASTVAALLTILGFSLYDTIIVFDRIRENIPRMPSAAFSQIVNRSMSEVIVRSLATSFCTTLPVIGLLLFGGETLKDFAFALMIGTLSGTYSSVFIASQVLSLWKEREPIYRARRARIVAEHGHVPAYAVATAGAPVDIAPAPRRRAPVTADPSQGVGQEEFEDMVANLGVESKPTVAPSSRPVGGRRARAREEGDGADKPRKPRNTRHGRPR